LARASLGFNPKFGWALAPYMLLKKRLDLEAPAATTLGEPSGEFRRRVRKSHSVNFTVDSLGLLGLRRLFVSIARQLRPAQNLLIMLAHCRCKSDWSKLGLSVAIPRYQNKTMGLGRGRG